MMKKKLMVLALTTLLGAGVLGGCSDYRSAALQLGSVESAVIGEGSGSGEILQLVKSFDSSAFDTLTVEAQAMEIEVIRSSNDQATIELRTDRNIENPISLEASAESGLLTVRVKEETVKRASLYRIEDQRGERTLHIALPVKDYNRIQIRNEFGRVEMEEVTAKLVEVALSAGPIRLNRVSGEVHLDTDAGPITVDNVDIGSSLLARTSIGDITIRSNQEIESAKLDLRSETGTVSTSLQGVEYERISHAMKVGSLGTNGPEIQAYSAVGDILLVTSK